MKKFLKNLMADKSGASAAEYALILGLVGVGIIVAATQLGTDISTAFTNSGTAIADASVS
jgi:pilus assembly protein Flp/PilA